MSEAAKKLRGDRLVVWNRMREILTQAETAEGGLSGELRTQYDAANSEFTRMSGELEARDNQDKLDAAMKAPQNINVGGDTEGGEKRTAEAKTEEQRSEAFGQYIRRGEAKLTPEHRSVLEFRDLSDSTGSAGGYTVPQGFLQKITERLKYFGPVRQIANVINTDSGQDLPWPNNDDTGTVGAVLAENVAITNADPTFGQKTLKAYVWTSGLVRVPNTLLNDSAFDVESWLAKKFGQRLGRGQNAKFTTGTGASDGISKGIGVAANLSTSAIALASTTGAFPPTYAELVSVLHGIDVAYRSTAMWMVSDGFLQNVQLLTDGNQRPLFQPAGSYGNITSLPGTAADGTVSDTLLGHPIRVNPALAAPAASGAVVEAVFGDFSAAYLIRDVLGVQTMRLTERYADFLQTGFFAFMRTDGIVDDGYAAVAVTSHA